jgi:hypothetical protein
MQTVHIKEKSEDATAMCGFAPPSPALIPWWESVDFTKRGGNATCGQCIAAAKAKKLL